MIEPTDAFAVLVAATNPKTKTPRKPRTKTPKVKIVEEIPDCPICLDPMKKRQKLYRTECNHCFHEKCFEKVRSQCCPYCRCEINVMPKQQLFVLMDEVKVIRNNWKNLCQEMKEIETETNMRIQNTKKLYKFAIKNYKESFKPDMDKTIRDQKERVRVLVNEKCNYETFEGLDENERDWKIELINDQIKLEKRYLEKRTTYVKKAILNYKKKTAKLINIIESEKKHLNKTRQRFHDMQTQYKENIAHLSEQIKELRDKIKPSKKSKLLKNVENIVDVVVDINDTQSIQDINVEPEPEFELGL